MLREPLLTENCDPCRRRFAVVHTAKWLAICALGVLLFVSNASAQILRVVTYNIDADTGGADGAMGGATAGPGLDVVLEAIGSHSLAGHAQPIDVLALQELNQVVDSTHQGPTTTLSYIVGKLNTYYQNTCGGCAVYDYDTTTDPTTGGTGGGPSGLIFNTKTVQKLSAAAIGSVSGSGAARAPMRYTLAPKGYNDHSADFSIYVSHMKSGDASDGGSPTNGARRNTEATTIRNDAYTVNDSLNGATSNEVAHIIYSGDYNMDGSSEAGYQTMISSSVHSGIMKANDTLTSSLSPANTWASSNGSLKWLYTESAQGGNGSTNGGLQYRDDVQYVTDPMLNQPGMQLVSGTLGPFGNDGSINLHGNVNDSNNTALGDLSNRTTVLNDLSSATDHYPVVADYSFATAVGIPGDYDHSGVVDLADYTLWRKTYGTVGSNLAADGNHNGIVDAADFLIWRRYRTAGSGAGSLSSGSAVPEPATWLLLLSGCLAFIRRSRLRG